VLQFSLKYDTYYGAAQWSTAVRFGVFIYDGVEPIDLATYGVLSMARRIVPDICICTIAPKVGVVKLSNGLQVPLLDAKLPGADLERFVNDQTA
jgi:hypothetical protein